MIKTLLLLLLMSLTTVCWGCDEDDGNTITKLSPVRTGILMNGHIIKPSIEIEIVEFEGLQDTVDPPRYWVPAIATSTKTLPETTPTLSIKIDTLSVDTVGFKCDTTRGEVPCECLPCLMICYGDIITWQPILSYTTDTTYRLTPEQVWKATAPKCLSYGDRLYVLDGIFVDSITFANADSDFLIEIGGMFFKGDENGVRIDRLKEYESLRLGMQVGKMIRATPPIQHRCYCGGCK